MKTDKILALIIGLFSALAFTSCEDKTLSESGQLGVKSVVVTNGGADGQTRVDGVLEADTFRLVVPPMTDLKKLKLEIVPEKGCMTTPASGTEVDFTQNNGVKPIIASLGADTKIYYAKVTTAAFQNEVALMSLDVTGVESPSYTISHVDKTIKFNFTNIMGTVAVLSNLTANPAGATITTTPALVDDKMTVDFASSDTKTITVSLGSKNITYTLSATISEAGFKPSTATSIFDQSLGNIPAAVSNNNTRGAFFDGRYVFYASREGGNNVYYYDIQDPGKEQKTLKMTDGVFNPVDATWAISDVRVAANGNIYACSMANAKDKKMRVYRWDDVTSEAVLVIEYTVADPVAPSTAVRLGDALSIIGDPKTNGYIIASNFPFENINQGQFYIWKFENGVEKSLVVKDLVGSYEAPSATDKSMGQYGRISAIPGENGYVVTGSAIGVLLLDASFDVTFELKRDTPIQGRAQDVNLFEYNGVRYMAYTVNREWAANDAFIEIVAITSGNTFVDGIKALAGMSMDDIRVYKKQITTNATKPAAWVVSTNAVKVVDDKVRVFGFVCEYGTQVIEFTK